MNDPRFTAGFWEERYAGARVWSGEPNAALVAEVGGLPAGRALDAGCGEGGDALWLARRGWRVVAVDVSATALRRAAAHTEAGVVDRITWREADLLAWTPEPPPGAGGEAGYDLVLAAFLQFPPVLRREVFARLASTVAPGGALVIVGHHPDDLDTAVRRPPDRELLYTADDLVRELADVFEPGRWIVRTRTARPREVTAPDGRPVTVHDTVLRAERSA
jgi:trans-aconitate methyltransferase